MTAPDVDRDGEGNLTDDRPFSHIDLSDIGIALFEYAQEFLGAEDLDRLGQLEQDDELLDWRSSLTEDDRDEWTAYAEHILKLAARVFVRARALRQGRVLP